MNNIKLLDCTLRDGGFVNDWDFGYGTARSVISRLDSAKVDVIEIGFVDERRPFDKNRTMFPDILSIEPMLKGMKMQHAQIAAMIDFGTCGIDRVAPKSESSVDIIRVIFKKKDVDEAVLFCDQIQQKGYKVSVQPVSITSYSEEELTQLIRKIDAIKPYSVAIVDTYGLMHNEDLLKISSFFNALDPKICIGFHSHNNFQMAYANSVRLINNDLNRVMIIDGSLYGMGKGAGNANTELLAQYLIENFDKQYNISQLLEAIDVDILKEYAKNTWGYSLKYFISASHDCHPDYVKFLMDLKMLSVKAINEILEKLPSEMKLNYSKSLIEQLYQSYQERVTIDDQKNYAALEEVLAGRPILIVAPGKSIKTESELIHQKIRDLSPVVISVNTVSAEYNPDYVFFGNPKRYSQFSHYIEEVSDKIQVIATSNVEESGRKIDYLFDFKKLKFEVDLIRDNPVLMLLRILKQLSPREICLAGFDGYAKESTQNYFAEYTPYLFCDDNVILRNNIIKDELRKLREEKMHISFLTPSLYE